MSSALPTRRSFARWALLMAAAPGLIARSWGQTVEKLRAIRREVFLPSPRPGVTIFGYTYYTRKTGVDLISMHEEFTRSDTVNIAHFRYSADNGATWQPGEDVPTYGVQPKGKLRRAMRSAVVDPVTGRFLRFWIEGVLETDNPLEGFWRWVVYYAASEDGGFNWYVSEEIICSGAEFNAAHPVPGVTTGKNCVMIGDVGCNSIFLADGTLLVPVIISPTGPDGKYYNPGGGYTYSDGAVIRGRWAADGRHLEWELSSLLKIDPALSTRGVDEPILAVLPDGRILALLRASNDKKPALPGYRWVAYSSDQGSTWTQPVPWTYLGGEHFFAPASDCQLINHSSGRIFWMGNISPVNPTGNRPRYPAVIGEVDGATGLLIKASVRTIDDRGPDDSPLLQLTGFTAREDRETKEIVLHLSRLGSHSVGTVHDWTASAYLYRIPV